MGGVRWQSLLSTLTHYMMQNLTNCANALPRVRKRHVLRASAESAARRSTNICVRVTNSDEEMVTFTDQDYRLCSEAAFGDYLTQECNNAIYYTHVPGRKGTVEDRLRLRAITY
jgi:hypothetical protein